MGAGKEGKKNEDGTNINTCVECKDNFFKRDAGKQDCAECAEGFVSEKTSGSTKCVCDKGKQPNAKGDKCEACAANLVKPDRGSGKCVACTKGSEYKDAFTCTDCPAGKEGFKNKDGFFICQECASGLVKPDVGKEDCKQCEAGKSTKDGKTCQFCDAGEEGKTKDGIYKCYNCQDNYYKEKKGQGNCAKCAEGFVSEKTSGSTRCGCKRKTT